MKEKLCELLPESWVDKLCMSKKETLRCSFLNEGPLGLLESKIGGSGYLPANQVYPRNEAGKPLSLLAQINFSEVPALQDFPASGLLAFYVDYTDDLIGLDFSNQAKQAGFRVLFFDDTTELSYTKRQQEAILAELADEELYEIVSGEFKMMVRKEEQYLCSDTYEFKEKFGKELFDWLNDVADDDESKEKIYNELYEDAAGSRVGGYPLFTQRDPRLNESECPYDTLLFQLDTEKIDNDWSIMWGDMGIGNFFIAGEALKRKDFTDVLYNWDCG